MGSTGPAQRLRRVRAAAVFVIAAVVPLSVRAEPPPTVDQLVGFFDSVALQDDRGMFGSEGTEPKPVSRWEQPIRVHIAGSVSGAMEARLTWHLERFRLLAGVELGFVPGAEQANLRIVLLSPEEVIARAGSQETLCLTQYEPAAGAIEQADIYLPVTQTVWLDNCMAHELLHAVGFFAHPKDNGNRSVLEQGAPPRVRTFTALDAAGIRMLYDPRLRVGLSRDRALPIARGIAEELLARWPDRHPPDPGARLGADGFAAAEPSAAAASSLSPEASDAGG